MKIIPKFASGGGFDSLFTMYTAPSTAQPRLLASSSGSTSSRSKSSDSDEEKGKITLKDLLTMVKDIDGLPNEMKAITNSLINTMRLAEYGIDSISDLATTYLRNLYKVKVAIQNKKDFEAAKKIAEANGAMAEPAITMDGNLLVQDPAGSVKSVTLSLYQQNKQALHPLSVSQLANLRAYDPSLINNYNAIDVISNSMGYEAFLKLLKEGITALGTSESQYNQIAGLDYKQTKELLTKLASMPLEQREKALNGVATEAISTKTQLNQLKSLREYLVALLPKRMQVWAAYKLGTSNEREATRTLVTSYLAAGADDSVHMNLDVNGLINRSIKAKEKEEKETKETKEAAKYTSEFKPNEAMKFLMGLGSLEIFTINPGGDYNLTVLARTTSVTNKSGEPLGANSTLLDLSKTSFGNILNLQSATIGGIRIDPTMFTLVLNSEGTISSIDYPYHEANGVLIPDITPEIKDAKEKANKELLRQGIDITNPEHIKNNYEKINLVYENNGLNPKYDSSGEPTNWARFGVFNAVVTGNVVGDDVNPNLLREVSDAEAKSVEQIIQKNLKTYNNPRHGAWLGMIGGSDAIYKGTVWIPIKKHAYQAASVGEDYKLGDVLQMERDEVANENYQANRSAYDAYKDKVGFKHGAQV